MKTVPDYNAFFEYTPTLLTDVGESAARISPLAMINRTGRVIYWDIFDSQDAWETLYTRLVSAGNEGTSIIKPVTGISMIEMLTSGVGGISAIYKRMPANYRHSYALEWYFSFTSTINWIQFNFVQGFNTPNDKTYSIIYDVVNHRWTFNNNLIVQYTFVNWLFPVPLWHHLKAVYDLRTNTCKYIIINGASYAVDMLADSLATPYGNRIEFSVRVNDTDNLGKVYIDNVIVTIDEPLIKPE